MKKITFCLSVLCASLQYASAQVSIMPEVGVNLANISAKDKSGGATESYKNKIGWKIGTSFMIPVGVSFFVQPGLFFTTKGTRDNYKETFQGYTYSYESRLNVNYLEIPFNVGYISNIGNAGSLFFTAGPYLGYGLSGKGEYREYVNGLLYPNGSYDVHLLGEDRAIKRFDLGFNFGVGYKFPFGVFARTQYGISLVNISNKDDFSVKNKGFSFSTGYIYTFKKSPKSNIRVGSDK